MSTPTGLGMRKGFDANTPLSRDELERIDSSHAAEKLKSPTVLPPTSPFITSDKHINIVTNNQHVLDAIYNRLMEFSPSIKLGDHIIHDWDRMVELAKQRFLPVVAQGNTLDGIGFREVFRPKVIDRPIDNSNKMPFDSRFGRDINVDISALHIAVSEFPALKQTRCNIHIDKLTVTLGGIGDLVGISPSVINHFVNELLFKTKMKGTLPQWILDAFDISLLNPDEGFLRAGIGAKIIDTPNFKWSISYSVGLNNNSHPEWSGSFKFEKSVVTGISGRFNLGGG